MKTKIPGISAARDVHDDSPKQAIPAAEDGATAAISAAKFLSCPKKRGIL
jgi:thioredoxin reductase